MQQKLNCVIIDDEEPALRQIELFCEDSPHVKIVGVFLDPEEFLKKRKGIDYDLCILDINMGKYSGTDVAQRIEGENKGIIFVTGKYDKLVDALNLNHIDVVPKPVKKEILNKALEKAHRFYIDNIPEYAVFHTDNGKISLKLIDVLYIKQDGRLDKIFTMRNGDNIKVKNRSFLDLLKKFPHILQVNKQECIAKEIVKGLEDHETILLNLLSKGWVTLSPEYKSEFKIYFPQM